MKKLLLVGKNSFIGHHCCEVGRETHHIDAISHRDAYTVDLQGYDCVINMSYRPEYFHQPYLEEIDFAFQLAQQIAQTSAHYLIMSTRRVYGTTTPFPVSEMTPLDPTGFYGANSAMTESKVMQLLGDRCTIVRGANVFGYEPGRHTFFGLAMTYLLEKSRLTFDFSPYTRRDFVPVQHFSQVLLQLAEISPGGIFNLGSGRALPLGQVALWLIEGFGQGELLITGTSEFDAFQLDISKLEALLGPQPDLSDTIRDQVIAIGQKIREAHLRRMS